MKIKVSEQEGLTLDARQAMCSVRQTYNPREGAEKKDALRGAASSRTGERGLLSPVSTFTASHSSCHPVLGPLGNSCSADQGALSCTGSAAGPGWDCHRLFAYVY